VGLRYTGLTLTALLAVSVPLRAFSAGLIPHLPHPPSLIVLAQEGGGDGGGSDGGSSGGGSNDGGGYNGGSDTGGRDTGNADFNHEPQNNSDRNSSNSDPAYRPRGTFEAKGVSEARRTLRLIQQAEGRFEGQLARCRNDDPLQVLHRCIANALDSYAKDLSNPQIELPQATRAIPTIVARTASRVRAAKTHRQARVAVKAAVAQIRKSITLIKAVDPAVIAQLQTRASTVVADSLEPVDAKLERAIGL
jgi:hypothetical protein